MAARFATRLFACYPAREANDPDAFVTAAAMLFETYPEDLAAKVSDPVRGLPSTNTFLPSIAEIRKALETEMVWHDAVVRRERERAHTAKVVAGHKAPVGSPEHRRVVEGFAALRDEMAARTLGRHAPPPDARFARTPEQRAMIAKHWDERLAALQADYAANPVSFSRPLAKDEPGEASAS